MVFILSAATGFAIGFFATREYYIRKEGKK